jgi:hypothetical protein
MAYFKYSSLGSRGVWRLVVFIAILFSLNTHSIAANGNDKLETRCGWFWNPSPANMWLIDRDGEWTIGTMGGHQAEGEWNWPSFKEANWVNTNRTYGYGCACFKLQVDKQSRDVLYIEKSWAKPLDACTSDPSIKTKPE